MFLLTSLNSSNKIMISSCSTVSLSQMKKNFMILKREKERGRGSGNKHSVSFNNFASSFSIASSCVSFEPV